MKERTSTSYRFTINMIDGKPATAEEQKLLDDFRATVSACNKHGARKMYVKLQGRLGKKSHRAQKYKHARAERGWGWWTVYQTIRLKDAARADVYVYER